MNIDHTSTAAYPAKTNGKAEKSVQFMKSMLFLNPARTAKSLQELTSAVNNRPAGRPGGGLSYERFFGRRPQLLLPRLPNPLSPQER